MKKTISLLSMLLFCACTISDTYYKPDVGKNNVGSAAGYVTSDQANFFTSDPVEKFSDYCWYLFGTFKMSSDCSPDMIADANGLGTITEINTQWQLFPFVSVQRTTIVGIPKTDK